MLLTINELNLDFSGKQRVAESKAEYDCCAHSEQVDANSGVCAVHNCGIQSLEARAIVEFQLDRRRE